MDIWTVAALPSRFGAESGNIRLTFSRDNTIHIIRDSFRKSEQRHFPEMSWNSTQYHLFQKCPVVITTASTYPFRFPFKFPDLHQPAAECCHRFHMIQHTWSSIHWMSPAHTSINWTAPRRVKTREPTKRKWGMENDDPSIVHRFTVAEFYSSSTSTFILCSMQHGYKYTYRYWVDTDTEIHHFLKKTNTRIRFSNFL